MNVLEEADGITKGARAEEYGSAGANAEVWARIASAATGAELLPEHLPAVMIALKLARLRGGGSFHRDSWVDVAGYARVAEMIEEERLEFENDPFLNGGREPGFVGPIGHYRVGYCPSDEEFAEMKRARDERLARSSPPDLGCELG